MCSEHITSRLFVDVAVLVDRMSMNSVAKTKTFVTMKQVFCLLRSSVERKLENTLLLDRGEARILFLEGLGTVEGWFYRGKH